MNKKKLTAVALSCALLISLLAGCGSNTDSQSGSTNSEAATNATEDETTATDGKTLVVYYSATGNTKEVGDTIADTLGAEVFELEPVEPYTNDDLNYSNDDSRVSIEHDNPDSRNVELTATTVDNWASYDTIYIGYPIWWGIAAWPVDGFVKANDFTGKTVIPFCTSSSSDMGESGKLLAEMAGTGEWQDGKRFSSGASDEEVQEWIGGLN